MDYVRTSHLHRLRLATRSPFFFFLSLSDLCFQHEYQVFTNELLSLSGDEHIQYACQNILPTLAGFAPGNMWTVTGEFTTATTDCATWLNGRGVGARWDGSIEDGADAFGSCDGLTGDWTTFSEDNLAYLRK